MFEITALYAGLTALILIVLTARVILYRRGNRISVGDKGDPEMLKRMRAHANCAETAPIALILLALVEAQAAPALAVHVLGLMLVAGRAIHGYGFSTDPSNFTFRVPGMALTLTMILAAALGLIAHSLF